MQVQNIECQIAQAQLGRYIAGEGMTGEAIHQLEAHINKCHECKAILEEKRTALVATLQGANASHPAPSAPKNSLDPRSSASRLAQALIAKSAVAEVPVAPAPVPASTGVAAEPQPSTKAVVNWKPIAYAGALAALLIGMSYLGRADLLGGKAASALPEKPEPVASKTQPVAKPKSSPATALPSPISVPISSAAPVVVPAASVNHPAVAKPPKIVTTVKPSVVASANPSIKPLKTPASKYAMRASNHGHVRTNRARIHSVRHNRIRIYDESGNAIN